MSNGPPPTAPTGDELADGAGCLLAEVGTALDGSHFAIINTRTPGTLHRYYDAAALRHCCQLLKDIETSSAARQEMTVRILGRVFLEAWLTALYIHFDGSEAIERIAQDTLYQVQLSDNDLKDFDQRLQRDKEKRTASAAKVLQANAGIAMRNAANPVKPATPLHDEPYISRLSPTGIDISKRITEDFNGITPRPLPLTEITDRLTKLGPEKGFARETFRPIYIYYRLLSAGAVHANINVYDAYYLPGSLFDRAAAEPGGDSLIMGTRITALYCTAFLTGWVLLDAGLPAPVATRLRKRLEPDPTGRAAWAPGTQPHRDDGSLGS
jgi:hypothetical protein